MPQAMMCFAVDKVSSGAYILTKPHSLENIF